MRKTWTKEDIEFLKNNYGIISIEELSNHLNTTVSSIMHKAKRENIQSARAWSEEEIQYLKNNYKIKTYKELSQNLNRTKSAIDLKINRLGLKKDKYTYNHDYFEIIDTSEKAYWLGFIYADGCVNEYDNNSCELSIKLQLGDIDHLKKFNCAVQGNVECTTFNRTCNLNGKNYDGCQIRFYSEKMVHDLEKYGAIPNKSLVIQFPNIEQSLISHFVRGFFDGDGCLALQNSKKKEKGYIRADFTCGSIDFVNSLREILLENKISSYIYQENADKPYRLLIGGMKNCDNFFKFIYKDATVYLERKYKKKLTLYKYLNIEQRLLRQSEKTGFIIK